MPLKIPSAKLTTSLGKLTTCGGIANKVNSTFCDRKSALWKQPHLGPKPVKGVSTIMVLPTEQPMKPGLHSFVVSTLMDGPAIVIVLIGRATDAAGSYLSRGHSEFQLKSHLDRKNKCHALWAA